MKSAKLVVGTLSINWSLWATFLMGFLTFIDFGVSFDDWNEIADVAYVIPLVMILGAFFMAGGIVMVVCHNRAPLAGSIACAAIFVAGLILSFIFGGRAEIAAVAFIVLLAFSIACIIVVAIQKGKNKKQQVA